MSEYEITYITNPGLTEDARGELDAAIDSIVEKLDGKATHTSENTRRRLAYPIQKQPVGFVRMIQISLDPEKIEELRQAIRKTNGVLRVSVLNTPRRQEVSAAIFDSVTKQQTEPKKVDAKAEPVTMKEVEEKIEKALDEEVK